MSPVPALEARAVVVGSGIAGLSAALTLGHCVVLTRGPLGSGCSDLAQGGIAAAVGTEDHPDAHAADTLAVGAGIGDPVAIARIVGAAPDRVAWLRELGARFDEGPDGRLLLGREAGHSARRIVHAHGDATGAEAVRALRAAVAARDDITVLEHHDLVDLVLAEGRGAGIIALDPDGSPVALLAPAVVLATGGIGHAYLRTTNPPEVAGDGLAVAARAGVTLADLEFVQFHPTALAVDRDPVPLLTEALRGEGSVLLDDGGERFMPAVHPDAELAPRDIVARAIWQRLAAGRRVYLDATTSVGDDFPDRFPTVWAFAREAGIDPRTEPLPVTPAAHYHMGGIATDLEGRTSLPGLWAAGEVGSTGLHGGNRLASNSLLEGMVLGAAAAASIAGAGAPRPPDSLRIPAGALDATREPGATVDRVREIMWHDVGLVRDEAGLTRAIERFAHLVTGSGPVADRNLPLVGRLVAESALRRTESRGAHFRSDHPTSDPNRARRSFVVPRPVPSIPLPTTLRTWSAA